MLSVLSENISVSDILTMTHQGSWDMYNIMCISYDEYFVSFLGIYVSLPPQEPKKAWNSNLIEPLLPVKTGVVQSLW